MKVEATWAMASRPGRRWRSRGGGRAGADGGGKPTAAQYVPEDKLKEVQRVLYGCNMGQPVPAIPTAEGAAALGAKYGFKTQTYKFSAAKEQLRPPRVVKVALLQNAIVLPTTDPFAHQKEAIHALVGKMIEAAAADGANIVCLQEAWNMPFAFATREKHWAEFAEDAYTGPATLMLSEYAKRFDMVIVSPILERDNKHLGQLWNTAVVIGHSGNVIGISRKNHIPRVGDFNESTYYMEGNTGHTVFHTKYGKIAINICYGRHHPMNWMGYALNGAEIIFTPSATVGDLSEPMWGIEARNASIANTVFCCGINRIGTETFPNAFTSGDGKPSHKDFGHFYGSSFVAGPDANRTPSGPRNKNGVLVAEMDLNLIQQVRDKWVFQMTGRFDMYADILKRYVERDFEPQVIVDPGI